MKKFILLAVVLGISAAAFAQSAPKVADLDYTFTTVKANPITSIKDQANSGTCWAYSTPQFPRVGGHKAQQHHRHP